jgi:hypothetical protein
VSTKTHAEVNFELSCPAPLPAKDTILLGHGSGGKLSAELIRDIFLPAFQNPVLARLDDQAIVNVNGQRLAITTDSFVVKPLFFPGGDIGSLAVHGTVNDLAMGGATPLFLSAAFIIEEGFSMDELRRVVNSLRQAAAEAGIQVVTFPPTVPVLGTRFSSAVRSAITASQFWRNARDWNSRQRSKQRSKATVQRCPHWWPTCSA